MASKNIVLCLDGTGNQFNEHNTNVVTLYRVLTRDPGSQVAYYDPGVGTLADPNYKMPISQKVNKLLGFAFGKGLYRNVEEAYSYLMEQYEEGDRIFLFGFSRGAYTARVLAGLIHACGVLEKGCQNLFPYALGWYRRSSDLKFDVLAKFKATYGRPVQLHMLGLWDTVSTFGWVYNPIRLPYTSRNPSVLSTRHALAIDEQRVFFRPNYWSDENSDTQQVWFSGVHSDVGGGYPEQESGLAKISLDWMLAEADALGLQIDADERIKYVMGVRDDRPYKDYVGPNHLAQQHQSLKGRWWIAEYLPQRIWNSRSQSYRWHLFPKPGKRRRIEAGSQLHCSVWKRMQESDYRPPNLPPPGQFTVVDCS